MDEPCLTDDTVLDFVAGRLADAARGDVERHLGHCLLCNRLVAVAAGYGHAVPANDLGLGVSTEGRPTTEPYPSDGESTTPALPLGTLLRDTYRLARLVGRGGMGEVFEASHARLPGRFAVKVLHPQCAADPKSIVRFRREAEITSGLRHPNIVSIVDFDYTPAGAPYLVMEFLEGVELARVIADEAPLPLERVLRVVDQMTSALAAVHRRGIVHRDLKPQNVFLMRGERLGEEHVKLCDFGISKVRAASVALTGERVLLGTPQYMAPEQARGLGAVDARADQFALATIVYEMLTGRLAFPGDRVEVVVYRITNEEPLPLGPPWGPILGGVLERALSKDPARRFASVEEFAAALRAAADARPAGTSDTEARDLMARTTMRGPVDDGPADGGITPTTVPPPPLAPGRGRAIASGLAAMAALAVVVVAALRTRPPRPPVVPAATVTAAPAPSRPPPAPPPHDEAARQAPVTWEAPPPAGSPPVPARGAAEKRTRPSRTHGANAKKAAALPVRPTDAAEKAPDAAPVRPRDSKLGSLIDRL